MKKFRFGCHVPVLCLAISILATAIEAWLLGFYQFEPIARDWAICIVFTRNLAGMVIFALAGTWLWAFYKSQELPRSIYRVAWKLTKQIVSFSLLAALFLGSWTLTEIVLVTIKPESLQRLAVLHPNVQLLSWALLLILAVVGVTKSVKDLRQNVA